MSYLVYLLNDQASGQPKILDSFSNTARLLKEQFQLEACHDAEGNFICFAPPANADRLPENEPDEDTAIFYSHNEQEGGSLWLKNPNESQLQLLLGIMLALNDGSYVLGDAGESYRVEEGAVVYTEPPATETPPGWRSKALQFRYSLGLHITLVILFVLLQVILHRIGWL